MLLLIVIVPAGFYTKFYAGPGQQWVANSVGGLLYEVFWCLVFAFIAPRCRPAKIALLVFGVTCMLEFLQLWHPPFLESLRSTFIGRTVLGNAFNWMDFPYYAAGCLSGLYLLWVVGKVTPPNLNTSGPQSQ